MNNPMSLWQFINYLVNINDQIKERGLHGETIVTGFLPFSTCKEDEEQPKAIPFVEGSALVCENDGKIFVELCPGVNFGLRIEKTEANSSMEILTPYFKGLIDKHGEDKFLDLLECICQNLAPHSFKGFRLSDDCCSINAFLNILREIAKNSIDGEFNHTHSDVIVLIKTLEANLNVFDFDFRQEIKLFLVAMREGGKTHRYRSNLAGFLLRKIEKELNKPNSYDCF